MSHSPPPGSWYPPQGSISGPPPMPTNSDRRSPGYNHGPPPDWYKWQNRGRSLSPHRNGSPRDHLTPRPSSPLADRNSLHRMTSSHNDRPPSPQSFQNSCPIRAPSPLLQDRPPSPRRERHLSPRRERLPSPRTDRPQSSPRRLHSPSLERHHSPRRERPLSPRRERPLSPRRERPLSPRRERPLSPRRERPPSPRRERPPSPRRERPLSPQRERPPSPRRERPPSPRRERPPSPRRERPPSPRRERPPSPRRERPPSPRRERPPSPRRERPLSPRRERPLSPRRERPISPRRDNRPHEWRPRSPPRLYGPPPHDWKRRSRSPPHWIRLSPPRYGPPRGRSPPRGYWGPPPPEWDRYRPPPYSSRRSPPRWRPPPSQPWERGVGQPPNSGLPASRERYPTSRPIQESAPKPDPSSKLDTRQDNKGTDGVVSLGDEKEEDIESYDLPDYNPEVGTGQKYVIAVSGFFCKICHKFYNSELSARGTHCKSQSHYDKFSKWLSDKKEAALLRKRTEAPAGGDTTEDEPPAKQIKLEPDAGTQLPGESISKYDPSQPTPSEPVVDKNENVDVSKENEINVEDKSENAAMETSTQSEDNGAAQSDNSVDVTALSTNQVKKEAVEVTDATLQNLRKLKVGEIRANLEKRGLKATGLKPHLLKCLEKVLMEEATAVASDTEENAEEEQKVNEEQRPGCDDNANSSNGEVYVLKLLESDVEPANRKAQWITERELERELLQLEGVKTVTSLKSKRTRLFNGRRTNVEWTITLMYGGEITEDGLSFNIPSHQHMPFVATLVESRL